MYIKVKVKVKVNFTLEQATKAQKGSGGIALLLAYSELYFAAHLCYAFFHVK